MKNFSPIVPNAWILTSCRGASIFAKLCQGMLRGKSSAICFRQAKRVQWNNPTDELTRYRNMIINKKLATLRFSYACHRLPGMRWLGRKIPPLEYYKWAARAARISYYTYPSDRRRARYLRQVLGNTFAPTSVKAIARKNVVYRQWQKILTHGWPSWAERCGEWAFVEGEQHLRQALHAGKGAVLLSGHSYGFVSLVAPLLSQRGYRLHRTGEGNTGDPAKRWGREWSLEQWEYNS